MEQNEIDELMKSAGQATNDENIGWDDVKEEMAIS